MTLHVVSVCKSLPTADSPAAGAFVMRRLAAMAQIANMDVVQPVPYFPLVRPLPGWGRDESHSADGVSISHAPMLYLPGILKRLDGNFLGWSIRNRLAAIHREKPIDVIDAHFGYPDGVGALQEGKRLAVPVFITVRGLEVDYLRKNDIRPQLLSAFHESAGIISVSQSLRRVLVENGIHADKIQVIPNAVDRTMFRVRSRKEFRFRLALDPDEPLIVSVGTMIELKRHHVLLEALAAVRLRLPNVKLAIIGLERDEPDYLPRLKKMTVGLGLEGSVKFLGSLAPVDVASWLSAADVFSLVSAREGCCNAVLEALASGRPVVASRVGDNENFVHPDTNGYLVEVDDPAGTARALHRALERRNWDGDAISAGLTVGNWADVARKVLGFFGQQLERRNDISHPVGGAKH